MKYIYRVVVVGPVIKRYKPNKPLIINKYLTLKACANH